MGLKYKNPNGMIVLAIKFNLFKKKLWKIVKTTFKNESCKLFFQKDAPIARKIRLFITFTLLIQMEWIKASHVDKNMIYKEKKLKVLFEFFCGFIFLPAELKFGLFVV